MAVSPKVLDNPTPTPFPEVIKTYQLLLKRIEIDRLMGKVKEAGNTLVPLSVYFSDGWAKVELGLARGKRTYDKRQDLAKRDAEREMARVAGRRGKGMR